MRSTAAVPVLTGRSHLSKGQLVDVEGRLQTRQWDDDAGKRHWKTEVVAASLEMLSGALEEGDVKGGAPAKLPRSSWKSGRLGRT